MVSSSTVIGSGVAHDGEWLRIRTDWNLPGLTITADFKPIDIAYAAGDEQVTEDSPGSYLVEYRIAPSNTRASGNYDLVIAGSTGVTTSRDTVTVTLAASSLRSEEIVRISANRFDPDAGETVTFSGGSNSTPLRVEIFTLSGQPVRVLEGNGFLEWNGTTESGRTVASGVYFLRVLSEGAEELRKVAVLRGGGS
ncbi:T9SS type A sorting domain-containing protein [bacterium]|nr:T9SS type A sorting domain-containing protein [bacterium]